MDSIIERINRLLIETTQMECMECGKKFNKKIGKNTATVKCPKCGGVDTEVA